VNRSKLSDDADGTGKGRQRAGVTVKDRAAHIMQPQRQRVEPDQKESRLYPGSFGEELCNEIA